MRIPPLYRLTPTITHRLQSIEASKAVLDAIDIPSAVETTIRRQSTLRSALFSARIEGNPLTLQDLKQSSQDQKRREVNNIFRAMQWIRQQHATSVSIQTIRRLHRLVIHNLTSGTTGGQFRTERSGIFDQAGNVIYLPPHHDDILPLLKKMLSFVNTDQEPFIPIRACLAHYTFEKIHPFLDGNGRVGRLLLQLILYQHGYGMKGLLPIEEYLDTNRSDYYHALELPEKNVTAYIEFMLTALAQTAEKTKHAVISKKESTIEDVLLPRRTEILQIIREHKMMSFDQIRRRFLKVNERTLRHDLKKLADSNLIKKRGTTRGAYYEKQ